MSKVGPLTAMPDRGLPRRLPVTGSTVTEACLAEPDGEKPACVRRAGPSTGYVSASSCPSLLGYQSQQFAQLRRGLPSVLVQCFVQRAGEAWWPVPLAGFKDYRHCLGLQHRVFGNSVICLVMLKVDYGA